MWEWEYGRSIGLPGVAPHSTPISNAMVPDLTLAVSYFAGNVVALAPLNIECMAWWEGVTLSVDLVSSADAMFMSVGNGHRRCS